MAKREAAKLAQGVHAHAFRGLDGTCYPQTNCEVNPSAVYTLKFRKFGEESGMREHHRKAPLVSTVRKKRQVIRALQSIGGPIQLDGDTAGKGELPICKTESKKSTVPLSKH